MPDNGVFKVLEAGHDAGDVLSLPAHGPAVHFQKQTRLVGQKRVPRTAEDRQFRAPDVVMIGFLRS